MSISLSIIKFILLILSFSLFSPLYSFFVPLYYHLCRPGGIPARNSKGERLLLFMGIIDILQSYRLKKKLEHTFKSLLTEGVCFVIIRSLF